MPAFYILFFNGIVLLWFLLSWLYKPLGKLVNKIFGDAVDIIKEEEE